MVFNSNTKTLIWVTIPARLQSTRPFSTVNSQGPPKSSSVSHWHHASNFFPDTQHEPYQEQPAFTTTNIINNSNWSYRNGVKTLKLCLFRPRTLVGLWIPLIVVGFLWYPYTTKCFNWFWSQVSRFCISRFNPITYYPLCWNHYKMFQCKLSLDLLWLKKQLNFQPMRMRLLVQISKLLRIGFWSVESVGTFLRNNSNVTSHSTNSPRH